MPREFDAHDAPDEREIYSLAPPQILSTVRMAGIVRQPVTVRAAGAIWVAIGNVVVSGTVAYGISVTIVLGISAASLLLGSLWTLGFTGVGVALISFGKNCWRGTISEVFLFSFVSLIGGLIALLGGSVVVLLAIGNSCGAISILFGFPMTMAGVLGLLGRADQKNWHYWSQLPSVEGTNKD